MHFFNASGFQNRKNYQIHQNFYLVFLFQFILPMESLVVLRFEVVMPKIKKHSSVGLRTLQRPRRPTYRPAHFWQGLASLYS